MEKYKEIIAPVAFFAILLLLVFYCGVIQPAVENKNIETFHRLYEEDLQKVLDEYDLELHKIEYSDIVPDYDLDKHVTNRISEYNVMVYLSSNPIGYSKIYEVLREISYNTNNYLLSNTYEILSDGAYVDDNAKETGFHEVITILIFDDNSTFRLRYSTTLDKNGEIVWKQAQKPVTEEAMVDRANAAGWDCMYIDCDDPRAEGRLYCHIHKCNELGCMHETSPLQSYCEQHKDK